MNFGPHIALSRIPEDSALRNEQVLTCSLSRIIGAREPRKIFFDVTFKKYKIF
jgi:hypothetical protein